ncbi:MAG: PspA/IM30 family protein [Eubacterium sp.]|nr:PspA/IM30 family protein [Eubacterium sp.]
MGILSRFKTIMASNINAIFNKDEKHPEKAIEKYLDQLKYDLGQVKSETAAHEMDVRRSRMAYEEKRAEVDKLNRYISKAEEAGNTSDVVVYQTKLDGASLELEKLEAKYNSAKVNLDNLNQMNEKLSSDIQTLEGKLQEIKQKMSAASAQEKMNQMAKKAGTANSDEMFEKMNEKADYALDKANAYAELENSQKMSDYDDISELSDKYENSTENSDDNDGIIDIR